VFPGTYQLGECQAFCEASSDCVAFSHFESQCMTCSAGRNCDLNAPAFERCEWQGWVTFDRKCVDSSSFPSPSPSPPPPPSPDVQQCPWVHTSGVGFCYGAATYPEALGLDACLAKCDASGCVAVNNFRAAGGTSICYLCPQGAACDQHAAEFKRCQWAGWDAYDRVCPAAEPSPLLNPHPTSSSNPNPEPGTEARKGLVLPDLTSSELLELINVLPQLLELMQSAPKLLDIGLAYSV